MIGALDFMGLKILPIPHEGVSTIPARVQIQVPQKKKKKKKPHQWVRGGKHLQSLSRRIPESPVLESLAGQVHTPVEHLNCNSRNQAKIVGDSETKKSPWLSCLVLSVSGVSCRSHTRLVGYHCPIEWCLQYATITDGAHVCPPSIGRYLTAKSTERHTKTEKTKSQQVRKDKAIVVVVVVIVLKH